MRQRVKAVFDGLARDPRPSRSRSVDVTGLEVPAGIEVRRLRMEKWRIVYAVHDQEGWVWVLAVRQRPPYEYDDLPELVARLS